MNVSLIVAILGGVLDLMDRMLVKRYYSAEELEAYIEERNKLRKQLVALVRPPIPSGPPASPAPSSPDQENDVSADPNS